MYAVILTGGKQYKVKKGDAIIVERLTLPEKEKEIIIKEVLMVSDGKDAKFGKPYLKDAKVVCEVVSDLKGEKTISYKYRRRKDSRWKKGHRQLLTKVKVKEIKA
jgi:large subunit ribosomal protein L21